MEAGRAIAADTGTTLEDGVVAGRASAASGAVGDASGSATDFASEPVDGDASDAVASETPTLLPGAIIADDRDWIGTIRQALPAARRVLANLRPTWELPGVFAIDAAFLRAAGIRGLVWDVDGTLTHRHGCDPAPEVRDGLERLLGQDGLRHVILSNCSEQRYAQLGALFPEVPVVRGYAAADGHVFRVRHRGVEQWSRSVGGMLRPVRKPDPALVRFALRILEIPDAASVAMVGDQYLTDIAAANLAGIRSIRVPTLGPSSFPVSVRVLQWFDQWLYRLTA